MLHERIGDDVFMKHEIRVYDHEHNSNNTQTLWVEILFDTDGDGEKEVVWNDQITLSDEQVTPQEDFEDRMEEFARKKIKDYKNGRPAGDKYVGDRMTIGD